MSSAHWCPSLLRCHRGVLSLVTYAANRLDGSHAVQGKALAGAASHGTLGVVTEPVHEVYGVSPVVAALAPSEPGGERRQLLLLLPMLIGVPPGTPRERAHVGQAQGASGQGLPTVRAAGGLQAGMFIHLRHCSTQEKRA